MPVSKYWREYEHVYPMLVTGSVMQYRGWCILKEVGSGVVLGSPTLWWGDGVLFVIKFPSIEYQVS